jgi:hypothetical protein
MSGLEARLALVDGKGLDMLDEKALHALHQEFTLSANRVLVWDAHGHFCTGAPADPYPVR